MGITSPTTSVEAMPYTKDSSTYVPRWYYTYREFQNDITTSNNPKGQLLTRTRTGEAVKDYKAIIQRQGNATSNFTGVYDEYKRLAGYIEWTLTHKQFGVFPPPPKIWKQRVFGDPNSFSYDQLWNPSISEIVARNRATIAFLKKARATQSAFQGMTFLGELRESLAMIRSPAKALRNKLGEYLGDVKRRKKSSPKSWKKTLSDTYLENVFGWIPLVNDITEGYKAYSNLVSRREHEQTMVTAYGIEEQPYLPRTSSNPVSAMTNNNIYQDRNRVGKERCVYRIRGMVTHKVEATTRDTLSYFGFRLEEFIPTAWNLLPWSFLADYFTNIGDVLEASAFSRADLAWSAATSIKFAEVSVSCSPSLSGTEAGNGGKTYILSLTGTPFRSINRRRLVSRTSAFTVGFPALDFELPGRPQQWINMLALRASAASIHPQRRYRH